MLLLATADLAADLDATAATVEAEHPGLELLVTASPTGLGIDELRERLAGHTSVMLGESGAGKSSLVNRLVGEERVVVSEIAGTTRDPVDTRFRYHGKTLVFVDTTGKEVTVPKAQIRSRAESRLSIMPNNFGEIIPVEEFNQLMAFLMASRPPSRCSARAARSSCCSCPTPRCRTRCRQSPASSAN